MKFYVNPDWGVIWLKNFENHRVFVSKSDFKTGKQKLEEGVEFIVRKAGFLILLVIKTKRGIQLMLNRI